MWARGQRAEALAECERRLAVVRHLRVTGVADVVEAQLVEKIAILKELRKANARLLASSKPVRASDHTAPVTVQDVKRLDENPNVFMTPIQTDPAKKTFSDPYWVWEIQGGRPVKVGVFKGPGKGFEKNVKDVFGVEAPNKMYGLDFEGEELFAAFGKELGVDVPACRRTRMTMKKRLPDGTVVPGRS